MWKSKPEVTQTRNGLKYSAITAAGKLFGLARDELESLANMAGLTLFPDGGFTEAFDTMLSNYPRSYKELCEAASVNERMFRHIRSGKHLRKETVLALAIVMCDCVEGIQLLLKKAGFVLSDSLPGDAIVKWVMKNTDKLNPHTAPIDYINHTLEGFGLPVLMTREWNEKPTKWEE